MSRDEIFTALRDFVVRELLDGKDEGLDGSTPLLQWGIINSISLMRILTFCEQKLNLRVPDDKLVPTNFETLDRFTDLLDAIPR